MVLGIVFLRFRKSHLGVPIVGAVKLRIDINNNTPIVEVFVMNQLTYCE